MFLFFFFFLFICQTFIQYVSSDPIDVGQHKLDNEDLQDRLFGFSSDAIKRRKTQMMKHRKLDNAPLIFRDYIPDDKMEPDISTEFQINQLINAKTEDSSSDSDLKSNSVPKEEIKVKMEHEKILEQAQDRMEEESDEALADFRKEINKNDNSNLKKLEETDDTTFHKNNNEHNSTLNNKKNTAHHSAHFRHSNETNSHEQKEKHVSKIQKNELEGKVEQPIEDSHLSKVSKSMDYMKKENLEYPEINKSMNTQSTDDSSNTNKKSSEAPSSESMDLVKNQTAEHNNTKESNSTNTNELSRENKDSMSSEETKFDDDKRIEEEETILEQQREKLKNKEVEEALLEIKEDPTNNVEISPKVPDENDKKSVSNPLTEEAILPKDFDKGEKEKITEDKTEDEKNKKAEILNGNESPAVADAVTKESPNLTTEGTEKKEIPAEENKKLDEKENKEDSIKSELEKNVVSDMHTSVSEKKENNAPVDNLESNISTNVIEQNTPNNLKETEEQIDVNNRGNHVQTEAQNKTSDHKDREQEYYTPITHDESAEAMQSTANEHSLNDNAAKQDIQQIQNKKFKDKIVPKYIPIGNNTVLEYSKTLEGPSEQAMEYRTNQINETTKQTNDDYFSEKKILTKGKNDKNEYEYFKLKRNGLKVLGITNKFSPTGSFSFSVECGGYDDFYDVPGAAHLLEHVLFYKSTKRNTTLLSELGTLSSKHNSKTNETNTNYFASSNSDDIYDLLKLFSENLFFPRFDEDDIANEVNEIHNEYITYESNLENCINTVSAHLADFKYSKSFIHGNYTTLCKNVLRSGLDIKKLLYDFHRRCYQPKNISLTILLGKKKDSNRSYHLKDIENMVLDIFGNIENEDISNEKIPSKYLPTPTTTSYIEARNHQLNQIIEAKTDSSPNEKTNKNSFVEVANQTQFTVDTDKKGVYVELLKKEGWKDGIYFYWTTKLNTELFKKMEQYGSLVFLKDICSNLKKDGLSYKLVVENKYAFSVEFRTMYNKHYLNYGIWINLTNKGKKYIDHITQIFNIFVKEISSIFNHESMGKGLNKYLLDYYREKDLITMKNYDSVDVSYNLNDIITFSNRMHDYSTDPNLVITVDSIFEDPEKNDFRNHIKITSLIGSLMKVDNINVIQLVDTFQGPTESIISNSNIKYTVQESPYLTNSEEIVNNINLVLPEITVCPSGDLSQVNNIDDSYFFCTPYNNRDDYDYAKRKWGSGSMENRHDFRANLLVNNPCLLKSVYGYNIYFKKGMVDGSRVRADFIFYYPSLNYTYQEAIYAHIHVLVIQRRLKQELLSEYSNCFVRLNVRYISGGYILHMESYSDFFAEFLQKVGDILSVKRFPEYDEFNMAYEELNAEIQSKGHYGMNYSLDAVHSLLSQYEPTNQEIYSSLNAFFFYPSYKEYTRLVKEYFMNNFVNVLIYGYPLSSSQEKEQILSENVANNEEVSENESIKTNRVPRDTKDVIFINDILNGNSGYMRESNSSTEKKPRKSRKQQTLEVSMNGRGTELTVQMCETFIKKVINKVIKKSNSTFYSKQFNNKENIEITKEQKNSSKENEKKEFTSLTVLYLLESKSLLTDLLITITADLMAADFVKLMKIRKRDGFMIRVQTFFTPNNMGGVLFMVQSENKNTQTLQADTCSFVKFISYEILNMDTSELVEKLRILKESYLANNTIISSNQEYTSLFEQLHHGKECFDKQIKIVKLFNEIINCPQILLKVIKEMVNNSKRIVFKEDVIGSSTEKEQNKEKSNAGTDKCVYMGKSGGAESGGVVSSLQLRQGFITAQANKMNSQENLNDMSDEDTNLLHKYEQYQKKVKKNQHQNLMFLPKFIQVQEKGIFKNIMNYIGNRKSEESKENYLDFKSCDEELSQKTFQVFNFSDITSIRNFFLSEFTKEDLTSQKCSIDYEEIRKYCYAQNDIE